MVMAASRTAAERYFAERTTDPEYRRSYEAARALIDRTDAFIRALDERREHLGLSKAELARRSDLPPAAVRRLFSVQRSNPTLETLFALADALELDLQPTPRPDAEGRDTHAP